MKNYRPAAAGLTSYQNLHLRSVKSFFPMKKILLTLSLCAAIAPAFAQKYMTRTGRVSFFSATKMENIEAINNDAACVIDSKSGDVMLQVPVKSFRFEKQLMQEHFNENYMESDKFPKAEFRGKIGDITGINFQKEGTYNVKAAGKLTMHGTTRDVAAAGTITIKGGSAVLTSKFSISPKDYGIKIPGLVAGKIAENIDVTVSSLLNPVKQ